MKNYIQVKKKYLFFREDAKNLLKSIYKKIKENKLKVISLDFSCVDFMSRSFIDEFLNILNELKREGVEVRIICLKAVLKDFTSRVKKTRDRIQNMLLTPESR